MRLVRQKLWRAFPELDAFDDALCRAFVRSATASWRGKLARWVIVAGVGVLGFGVAFAVSGLLSTVFPVYGYDVLRYSVLAAALVVLLLVAFGGALLMRDYLLRWQVRRVIRGRGACAQCRYPLLGMTVGENLRVVCPECGFETKVDAALGELVPNEKGQATFNAVAPRLDERGRLRRRKVKRVVGFGTLGIVGTAAVLYGCLWLFLLWQASVAKRDRNGAEKLHELIVSNQPIPGAIVEKPLGPNATAAEIEARNRWQDFVKIVTRLQEFSRDYPTKHNLLRTDEEFLYIDYPAIIPLSQERQAQATPDELRRRELDRRYALDAMEEARRDGLLDELRALRSIEVAFPTESDWTRPNVEPAPPLSERVVFAWGSVRDVVRLCSARMYLAVKARDADEYVAALDEALALARIVDAQCLAIDRLVANVAEGLIVNRVGFDLQRIDDPQWIARIQERLRARTRTVRGATIAKGESLVARDWMQWFFGQPRAVHRCWFTREIEVFKDASGAPVTSELEFFVGTFGQNTRELDALTDSWVEQSGLPMHDSTPRAVYQPQKLLTAFGPATAGSLIDQDAMHQCRRDGLLVLLGVRHYELRTGVLPRSLADLTPDDLPTAVNDPLSGGPFKYTLSDPTTTPRGRRFLLYSVGFDGKDDGGAIGPPMTGRNPMRPGIAGTDEVINAAEDQ